MFAYVLGFASHPCKHNLGIYALPSGQMAEFYTCPLHRPETKSAAHLLKIEGGERDLFDRYVAASTPTHTLQRNGGTETQKRTQKQAASQRAVSVFPQHAGAWLKHTFKRPALHTREHGAQRNAHLADDRAKSRNARLRCRDLMKLVQAFGPRGIRQREKIPWAFSRLKDTPAQVGVRRCDDVCGRC